MEEGVNDYRTMKTLEMCCDFKKEKGGMKESKTQVLSKGFVAAPLNLIQEAKGVGRMTSALPDEGLTVYLVLRFNLSFWFKMFTLPCLHVFFPSEVATARDLEMCAYDWGRVPLKPDLISLQVPVLLICGCAQPGGKREGQREHVCACLDALGGDIRYEQGIPMV